MASAPLVITGSNGNATGTGSLFEGLKFFLLRRIPQRSRWVEAVEANGGKVVATEANADYVIADHARSDAPGGSYSWTFIEAAVKSGELPDPGEHATGTPRGAVREVGSARPPKSTRCAFTREDDLFLWNFVQKEKAKGERELGLEIYKRLEDENPRHTYQSWQDRYRKKLKDHPPAGAQVTVPANPPPSPPTDREEEAPVSAEMPPVQKTPAKKQRVAALDGADEAVKSKSPKAADFSRQDFDSLMQDAEFIEDIDEERMDEAWAMWMNVNPHHSAGQWLWFWTKVVRPEYLKHQKSHRPRGKSSGGPSKSSDDQTGRKKLSSLDKFAKEITGRTEPDRDTTDHSPPIKKRKHKTTPENSGVERPLDSAQKRRKLSLQPHSVPYVDVDEDPNATKTQQVARDASHRPASATQQPSDNLPTSELNHQAKLQLQAETENNNSKSGTIQTPAEVAVMTSDANRDANMQLQKDSMQAGQDADDLDRTITSEANEAADSQLQRESVSRKVPTYGQKDALFTSEANTSADQQLRGESRQAKAGMGELYGILTKNSTSLEKKLHERSHGRSPSSPARHQQVANAKVQELQHAQSPLGSAKGSLAHVQDIDKEAVDPPTTPNAQQGVKSANVSGTGVDPLGEPPKDSITRPVSSAAIAPSSSKPHRTKTAPRTTGHTSPIQPPPRPQPSPQRPQSDIEPDEPDEDIREPSAQEQANTKDADITPRHSLLTEANLASQQAQHKPKVHRGLDLPEDDENKDQTDMIQYLQELLSKKTAANEKFEDEVNRSSKLPSFSDIQENQDSGDVDQDETITYPDLAQQPVGFVPLSSQPEMSQPELDQVLDDVFQWPNSPEQRQQGANESQLETRAAYPELPPPSENIDDATAHDPGSESPTAKLLSQLNTQFQPGDSSTAQGQEFDEPTFTRTERVLSATDDGNDDHDMDVDEEGADGWPGSDRASMNELDFNIPSPPGGFGAMSFEASPTKYLQSSDFAQQETEDVENELPVEAPLGEIVEISSRASSSSYHSSEPEEPAGRQEEEHNPESQGEAQDHENRDFEPQQEEQTDEEVEFRSQDLRPQSPRRPFSKAHAVETQDILSAETQIPDFDIPLPPSSDADPDEEEETVIPESSPARPPLQPQSPLFVPQQDDEEEEEEEFDLESFLETMKAKGYSQPSIIRALKRTSADPDLARLVLLEEKSGRGLPKNIPGIWSEREDEILMGTDATMLRRLAMLHGDEECDHRRRFLEEA